MEFHQLVDSFYLLTIDVEVKLNRSLNIVGFAGDMLHNNFGKVLKQIDPQLANHFFDTDGQVKQFSICPTKPLKRRYGESDYLSFTIKLFNQYCEYLPVVLNALEVWQLTGFSPDKKANYATPFTLESIQCRAPLLPKQDVYRFGNWSCLPQSYSLADSLQSIFENAGRAEIANRTLGANIAALSPIRLTFENAQLRQPPNANIWFNNIVRRLWLLAAAGALVNDCKEQRDIYYDSVNFTNDITLTNHTAEFYDLHRVNARAKNSQSLGGLIGCFSYHNLDIRHLALLQVGQELGVGSKTTFGFGHYQWRLVVG